MVRIMTDFLLLIVMLLSVVSGASISYAIEIKKQQAEMLAVAVKLVAMPVRELTEYEI